MRTWALGLACVVLACGGESTGSSGGGGGGSGGSSLPGYTPGTGGVAGGSGGGGGGGTGGAVVVGTTVPLADLPATYAPILCDYFSRCLGVLDSRGYYSSATCVSDMRSTFTEGTFTRVQSDVAAGIVTYDAALAATCLSGMQSAECGGLTPLMSAACASLIEGHVALGGACSMSDECAAGLYCALDIGCPSTCRAVGGVGAACSDDEQCADGLACSSAGTCAATIPAGAACTDEDVCAENTTCSDAGVCEAVFSYLAGTVALGQECGLLSAGLCVSGLYCVSDVGEPSYGTAHCTAERPSAGGACRFSMPEACPTGQRCVIASGATEGTCTPLAAAGAACEDDSDCQAALVCAASTCLAKAHVGEACVDSDQCFSSNCVGGTCQLGDCCAP